MNQRTIELTIAWTIVYPQDDDEDVSVKGLVSAAKEAFKGKVKERIGGIAKDLNKGLRGAKKSLKDVDDVKEEGKKTIADGKKLIEDTIDDGKEIANKADQHAKDALALGEKAISAGRQLKPMVGSALNIGPKLRILEPSSLDVDLGVWESMTTVCTVRDFQPGYIVVALEGTKFEEISDSYRPQMFVVTMAVKETAMYARPLIVVMFSDISLPIRGLNTRVYSLMLGSW